MPRRAAHVDIDDVGASSLRDPSPLGHPVRFAAGQLHDMRANAGRLAAQPGHRLAVDEIIAGRPFGNNEARAQMGREPTEGSIGNAGHGRQKNSVGELNIAYFQWFGACAIRAGHGVLVSLADTSLHPPLPILSTNLVQSSFMPTL